MKVEQLVRLRLLESIVSNTRDAILVTEARPVDEPGPRIVYANESFTRMTGYTSQEIVGKTPRILQGPDTDRAQLDEIRAAFTERRAVRVELLNYHKDGSQFWVEVDIVPVTDESGEHTHWVSVQRDITERRRQKEALKESEERLSTILVQYASDIITILEPDGAIRYQSPAVERVLGYEPRDLVGKSILDYVHPEDVERAVAELGGTRDESGVRGPVEARFLRKDGSWRYLEGVANNLIGDPAVGGVVINSRDITARKEAEEALAESRDLLQAVMDGTTDAVYVKDTEGRYLMINPAGAEFVGKSVEEVIGKDDADLFTPEDARHIMEKDRQIMASGETQTYEENKESEDDAGRTYITTRGPYRDHRGEFIGVFGVSRDITQRKDAEDKVREAEERYRNLVERVPAIIYIQTPQPGQSASYDVSYMSPRVEEILGYPARRFVEDQGFWNEVVHPDDLERLVAEDERTDEMGEPFSMEYRMIAADGRVVWVRDEAGLIRDPEDEPLFWQGVLTDITKRKKTELELQESERRFRQLFEQSVDAMYVHDEDGRFIDCNFQASQLLGYSREELLSMSVSDVSSNVLTEEERARKEEEEGATLWQCVMDGEPGVFSEGHEEDHIRKDGTIVPVEVRVGSVDYGGRRMILASVRDITERRHTEAALKESEARFRSAFEDASTGMALVSLQDRPFRVNRALCEMLGYPEEEILGRHSSEFTHPGDIEETDDRSELLLADEGPDAMSMEKRYLCADGRVVWAISDVSLVRSVKGEPSHFICQFQDITERKLAEEELRRSEARLKTVAAGAPVIMFAINSEGMLTFDSVAALEDLGLEPGADVGHSVFEAYADLPEVLGNVRRSLSGEEVVDTVRIGGRAYHATYSPQRDEDGKVHEVIGVATDVTKRWELERDLEHLATHDPLTGLANRRLLFARLSGALERTKHVERMVGAVGAQQRGRSLCLLFMDLNGFKEVNDRYGHEVGDALIEAVAGRIERCLRPSDMAARVGGDEFCVLLEGASGAEEAVRVAERLVASLESPFSMDTSLGVSTVEISASIGIIVKNPDSGSRSPDELMREADAAMYRAKKRGGALYEVVELTENAG